jgi:ankyrin repeat protein
MDLVRASSICVAAVCAIMALPAIAADLRAVQASQAGNASELKAVLLHSNVNARSEDGSTALLWATYRADPDMVRMLIAAGADVEAANHYGVTPLLEASEIGNAPILEALLKGGAKWDLTYKDGETVLMEAARTGSLESVDLLIAKGMDVDVRETSQQQTALMWASIEGHLGVVKALLKAGAQPNLAARSSGLEPPTDIGGRAWLDYSRGGLTALMFAAREGHGEVVRVLLDAGADPNVKTSNGLTAMMLAVLNDRLDTAKLLLDHGANPNDGSLNELISLRGLQTNATASDASRPRPSHANTIDQLDLAASFLDKGADPKSPVKYTLNSDGTAFGSGIPNESRDPAYVVALQAQDADVLRMFLERKLVDPNVLPGAPSTPLLAMLSVMAPPNPLGATAVGFRYPAERGAPAMTALLIKAGADVNAVGPGGERAIHRAAQNGDLAVIQELADAGSVLDVKTDASLTPVDLAAGKRPPAVVDERINFILPPPEPHLDAVALLDRLMGVPKDRRLASIE